LFESFSRGDIFLIVPVIAYYEVASTILRDSRQQRLSFEAADIAIEALFGLELAVVDTGDHRAVIFDAYKTARANDCGFYDAIFLVLSQSLDAPLSTADKPLSNAARHNFDVRSVADLELP